MVEIEFGMWRSGRTGGISGSVTIGNGRSRERRRDANLFAYQQITGDSGSGALLGSFEGRTVGIGPVLSYVRKAGNVNFAAEAKWLPELAVEHRLKGNIAWFKLAVNVPF
jgi:Putative MetA-pathway of phenol degradation